MHQLDMGFAGVASTATRARAKAREADWRRQLARAFVYATGQSPGAADEFLAEYERREREGPDFMRQRPGSVIAEAPVVTLDRNGRMRLVWKFRMLTRRSWVNKETGKHRGVITRTAESVFGALLYLTEKYGRVFPSLEGLAHLAMCCKQSVVTALLSRAPCLVADGHAQACEGHHHVQSQFLELAQSILAERVDFALRLESGHLGCGRVNERERALVRRVLLAATSTIERRL